MCDAQSTYATSAQKRVSELLRIIWKLIKSNQSKGQNFKSEHWFACVVWFGVQYISHNRNVRLLTVGKVGRAAVAIAPAFTAELFQSSSRNDLFRGSVTPGSIVLTLPLRGLSVGSDCAKGEIELNVKRVENITTILPIFLRYLIFRKKLNVTDQPVLYQNLLLLSWRMGKTNQASRRRKVYFWIKDCTNAATSDRLWMRSILITTCRFRRSV